MKYASLRNHTLYSIGRGAIHIYGNKGIAKQAKERNINAIAITDSNFMGGIVPFTDECLKSGIQPIIGSQITLHTPMGNGDIIILVCTKEGYTNLVSLSSKSHERNTADNPHLLIEDLSNLSGLIVLSGGMQGIINRLLIDEKYHDAENFTHQMKALTNNKFFIEISRTGQKNEEQIEQSIINLCTSTQTPLVATNEAWYLNKEDLSAQETLLCISKGQTLFDPKRERTAPGAWMRSEEEMVELFHDLPEALENTVKVAQSCGYGFENSPPMLPRFPDLKEGQTEAELIRQMSVDGLNALIAEYNLKNPDEYYQRLDYELSVIERMGFPGYFLIVSDFIRWAKSQNIPVGPGRGSGAGSLVAWALSITDINPLEHGLLFERFLNPDRVSMPDFDIDFCQEKRDEVIQYVRRRYDFNNITHKEEKRVAQIATFMTLKARNAVMSVGRAMGLPFLKVQGIAQLIPNDPAHPTSLEDAIKLPAIENLLNGTDADIKQLFSLALGIENLLSNISTHAAGVVISRDPIAQTTPLARDVNGVLITQFNMKYVERGGQVKFDFLGLKTLDIIQGALEMIENIEHKHVDFRKIGIKDYETYQLIAQGKTYSVFQLESEGMKGAIRQISPDRFSDIVALVSLYRPGPMENIPVYGEVKSGQRIPQYLDPQLESILKETNSIIVYQEQVMEIAKKLANYTLGGADLLRRAMGKKIKSEMEQQRDIFIKGASENNIPLDRATAIFDLMEKFADYGFNKSHAAAYALIAFQTAYLKAHHPASFYASCLNLEIGKSEEIAIAYHEAKKSNVTILPPDVQNSYHKFRVEIHNGKPCVRFGLSALRDVGSVGAQALAENREKFGKFKNFEDFVKRGVECGLKTKSFEQIIAAGGCECFEYNRATLTEYLPTALAEGSAINKLEEAGQISLFGGNLTQETKIKTIPEWDEMTLLAKELKSLGFYWKTVPAEIIFKSKYPRVRPTPLKTALEGADSGFKEIYIPVTIIRKIEYNKTKSGTPMGTMILCGQNAIKELAIFGDIVKDTPRKILNKGMHIILVATTKKNGDGDNQIWVNRIASLEDL